MFPKSYVVLYIIYVITTICEILNYGGCIYKIRVYYLVVTSLLMVMGNVSTQWTVSK